MILTPEELRILSEICANITITQGRLPHSQTVSQHYREIQAARSRINELKDRFISLALDALETQPQPPTNEKLRNV